MKGALKKTLDVLADEARNTAQAAKQQVTGHEKEPGNKSEKKEVSKQQPQVEATPNAPTTEDIVKSFYAESNPKTPEEKKQQEIIENAKKKGMSPQEWQEYQARLAQLHKESYYNPTFNRPTQQQEQEERPAEKVEREKMEELQLEQKKSQEKPPPLQVRQAQNIEKNRGSAG